MIAWAWFLGQVLALMAAATLAFDIVHWLLHACMRARSPGLRRLAAGHAAHHVFFDERLRFDPRAARANLVGHAIPEYVTQVALCAAASQVFDTGPVLAAIAGFTALFVAVVALGGRDRHHLPYTEIPATHGPLRVGPAYHALHHVFPDQFFASFTTVFDRIFATACPLRGRRIALTGATGAFGGPLRRLLEARGAEVRPLKHGVDFGPADARAAIPTLAWADVLVLAHGSKVDAMAANCGSFVALIEAFRAATRGRLVPPEVWALGSEIECHPALGDPTLQAYAASKRAFARHARRYARDPALVYRHIVPSAFRSPLGFGLISGALAARGALALIRRGCCYVPVSYTGVALVNAIAFRWGPVAPASDAPEA